MSMNAAEPPPASTTNAARPMMRSFLLFLGTAPSAACKVGASAMPAFTLQPRHTKAARGRCNVRATVPGRGANAYKTRHLLHSEECEMVHYRRIIGGAMEPSGIEVDEAEIDAGGSAGAALGRAHGVYCGDALRGA